VIVLLTARRVTVSFENNRTSYDPAVMLDGVGNAVLSAATPEVP